VNNVLDSDPIGPDFRRTDLRKGLGGRTKGLAKTATVQAASTPLEK